MGILSAYYLNLPYTSLQQLGMLAILVLMLFSFIPITLKFKWLFLNGWAIHLILFVFGAGICNHQDLQKNRNWVGYHYNKNDSIFAIIQEPLIQKRKTWKALAEIVSVKHQGKWEKANSKIWLYIKSNELAKQLATEDAIQFTAPLQKISNNNNSSGFDYEKYCAFQQIYFQVYLPDSAKILTQKRGASFRSYLYQTRDYILNILKKAIPEKTEQAVAEALLIGYKEDLDKKLVQSYSNTGVVHIIAISGLHLAMIYGLLIRMFQPLGNGRWKNFLRTGAILFILWGFSFITGGAAAILRSAVGFSFLLFSKSLGYKNNTLNTLFASAFFLLLFNPFLLWDIGFQLSYTAVLGIVLFSKWIENWFRFSNKLLQMIWQVNAITVSAQILTLPIVLYQFHQFPNLFLFTNFLIVPLSGIILYAELLVLLLSPSPFFLQLTGRLTSHLIGLMNLIIERTNRIPFALTRNIQLSLAQAILLYLLIAAVLVWLIEKSRKGFLAAVLVVFFLVCMRTLSFFIKSPIANL